MTAEPTDGAESPDPRFFSLDDANRMLPLVRRIVEDILARYLELEPLYIRLRARTGGDPGGSDGGTGLRAQVQAKVDQIEALVAELHALGCRFKGFRDGLVDWYSYYAGRPVLLCWKLGEPAIEWWHQLDAGFVGRQRILDSQRNAFRATPGPAAGPD